MMQRENLTELDRICINYNIDASFIHSLQETGLIEVVTISETFYIENQQLLQLEKYINFYNTLDINLAGIETISHLLQYIKTLQEEVNQLQNKLQFFEATD